MMQYKSILSAFRIIDKKINSPVCRMEKFTPVLRTSPDFFTDKENKKNNTGYFHKY
jgi:hypothetical protein